MIAGALLAFAAAVGLGGAWMLRDRGYLLRVPRLGLAAWTSAVAAVAGSVVGAGFAATLPLIGRVGGVAEFVHRCPQFVRAVFAQSWSLAAALTGLGAVALTGSLFVVALVRQASVIVATGRRHQMLLAATGQLGRTVAVVPDARPAAWSLATGGGSIVVTRAAVEVLSGGELAAVLAHERAHVAGRHHLLLLVLRSAARALPCPLTRAAVPAVAELLEMRADDVAATAADRVTVAEALLRLSGAPPPGALAAGGTDTARRVARLLAPPSTPRWPGAGVAVAALAATAVPVALSWAALAPMMSLHFCPLPS